MFREVLVVLRVPLPLAPALGILLDHVSGHKQVDQLHFVYYCVVIYRQDKQYIHELFL